MSRGKPIPTVVQQGKLTYGEYRYLHLWVKRKLGRPQQCAKCGVLNEPYYDWANISGEYKKDLSDWIRLCRACHTTMDRGGADYWKDEYCLSGHRLTIDRLYLRKDKRLRRPYIECKTCQYESMMKSKIKLRNLRRAASE